MMSHAKNKVEWCLNKAKKELQEGKKHRGFVKVEADLERAREYLAKARTNLELCDLYKEKGFEYKIPEELWK